MPKKKSKAAAIAGEPPSPLKPVIEIEETAPAAEQGAAEGSAASTPGGGGSGVDTPSSTPASTPAADAAPAAQAAAPADGAKADGGGATTPSSVSSKPPPGPVRSAKERQLGAAWGQLCKSVEKNQVATYQNVEKEVANVGKVLQANAAACQETQKNVWTAKELLCQISTCLENVDTLVVPIVLQREGNF